MRHWVIAAAVGAVTFLMPLHAAAGPAIPLGDAPHTTVVYALDNPAQPGDAFPNSPYSGGTD